VTTAVLPSMRMSAPRRISSTACMKRFSKIVSRITADALGDAVDGHELRLHVGREGRIGRGAQAHRLEARRRLEADRVALGTTSQPASISLSITASR
jgi:hypothetical protein